MTYLKVAQLIEELKRFDPNLPVIITREGNDHSAGITDDGIVVRNYAYFPEVGTGTADEAFTGEEKFLEIGRL